MRKRYQSLLVHVAIIAFDNVRLREDTAEEAERFEWGERIREVEQGPEGALFVLEDGDGGRLMKLAPGRLKSLSRNKGSIFDCKMFPTQNQILNLFI